MVQRRRTTHKTSLLALAPNAHAHPTSARHGLTWYEFEPSWLQIRLLKFLGIAKGIQVAKVNSGVAERDAA
jgi:stearoyl-CoA desaturase (delta-9 desaturase)